MANGKHPTSLTRPVVAATVLLWLVLPAGGHEWFEPACCGGDDCKEVEDGVVKYLKEGVSVEGFGILSYQDTRLRWSRTDRDYVCAVGPKLYCVYRKPQGF